ncbi:LOW QUALITY PROTEIN: ubiquitin carboxyl-terminal hydrolase 36-like [Pomacea canaliculata]|uniref:LOW QUALITY PROTEIN: ubiquitin carboxyl-terminal hydrolase 36-like n=1 Tax=Pomacea canaliculata TaxID=400727 RepID=UPI000D731007|nr:LOW QUALITY PROTEIN: ubiquitin carboxyl-terminal hydrolase 36-like [Pomacea canaliculata]
MPSAAENLEVVESTLRASLSQNKHLDQHVVSSTQRVLMHRVTFVPAAKPHTLQLRSLKSKYILLSGPTNKAGTPEKAKTQFGIDSGDCAEESEPNAIMSKPGPSGDASANANAGEGLPSPRVVLYPPERVRLDWRQAHRIGAGLVNLGNTCFFNSTLQCLTYTAPLVNYCFSEEHPKTCKQQNSCLMCELRRHIRSAFQHSGHAFKPQLMLQKLKSIAKHMRWGRQEDAHEFLRYLVDGLQRACLNGYAKLDKFSKETTIINQIFGGFLRSQVQCMKCSARSNTYDPFMDLSLDIKGVYTVEDALAKFVKAETLDSDNAYKCEKCQQKVPAQKRFSIHKAPNVLTLQLNRFDYNRIAGKINRHIQFPEKLNIRPYMSQKQGESVMYSLYGVLIHSGFHCNSGHYYCYVKAPSKTWYLMNDSMVRTVPASRVFQAEAYLLFYSRLQSNINQSPAKAPFIGPASNGVNSPSKFSALNGSHAKSLHSADSTNPVKNEDVGVSVSRQTLSPSGVTVSSSASFSGVSGLPEKHKKISFGISSPKPFQQVHQQQNQLTSKSKPELTTASSASVTSVCSPGVSKPRIVMHIKNGKATTIEKSPDGKSKVVNGGASKHSTLVPYDDDSESEEDRLVDRAKVNQSECVSAKKEKKFPTDVTLGTNSTIASRNSLGDKSGEQCEKVQIDSGGRQSSLESTHIRKDLTLQLNKDCSGSGLKRMSVDIQADIMSPSKVNATTSSWFVQMQDSAPSPSLGSCSSANSNHSVNSTTEWHVLDMSDHKSSLAADRKMQHSGWTITDCSATDKKDGCAKQCSSRLQTIQENDNIKRVRLKSETLQATSRFCYGDSTNTDKIVHKKHKKKKHKRDKEREKSRVKYEELQNSPDKGTATPHIKHKKKKHKSRDRGVSDSDQREKRRKEIVSVQSWDHHDKYSSDHNYQNGDRPKMLWDGMRKSQVVKELEEKPTVISWDEGCSQDGVEAEKEKVFSRKRSWSERYEEDIDKGKVKKVKKHHDYNYYTFNPFQRLQNDKNHTKRRDSYDANSKHQSYNPSSQAPNRTYSDQTTCRFNSRQQQPS